MIIGWIRLISFNWKWNVTIINLCLVFEMNLMWKPNNPTTKSEIPGARKKSGLLDEFPERKVVAFRDSSLPSSSSLPPTFLLSLWQTGWGKGKRGGRVEGRRQTTVGRLKAPVREKEERDREWAAEAGLWRRSREQLYSSDWRTHALTFCK